MTQLFGDIIKLKRFYDPDQGDMVIATVVFPKSLKFLGKDKESQIRFEDLHFGRVRLIQDDVRDDV
jgi:hypothetical protein